MAFKLNDRVKESSATTGTGTFTLGGAVSGFETFSAGIGGGNTTYYCIFETGTNNFEVGFGTLNGGASTLARTNVISSSNSDALEDFGGATEVFCTVPGAKIGLPFPQEYGSSSAPKIITVKVGTKTTAHPYSGQGSSSAYFFDGLESPALRLSGTDSSYKYYYRFDQADSTNSGHPLRFYLEADKTTAYTTGVTTNGTPGSSGAYTQIAVDENTPNILYYQCSSHSLMGNSVLNIGNTVNINSVTGQIIPGKIGGTNFTNSILVGHSTTGTLSSAENNTAVGIGALDAISSGSHNTMVGKGSGTSISTGGFNVGIGKGALGTLSTSSSNVAIGYDALAAATGHRNTAIGKDALKAVIGGAGNIGIGEDAGDNITTGSGNVIIGKIDAASATGDSQLKIADANDGSVTWISGDSSGNITVPGTVTANGTVLSAGVSAGFAVAMAIAL